MKTFVIVLRDKKHIELKALNLNSALYYLKQDHLIDQDEISSITILDF